MTVTVTVGSTVGSFGPSDGLVSVVGLFGFSVTVTVTVGFSPDGVGSSFVGLGSSLGVGLDGSSVTVTVTVGSSVGSFGSVVGSSVGSSVGVIPGAGFGSSLPPVGSAGTSGSSGSGFGLLSVLPGSSLGSSLGSSVGSTGSTGSQPQLSLTTPMTVLMLKTSPSLVVTFTGISLMVPLGVSAGGVTVSSPVDSSMVTIQPDGTSPNS